MKFCCVVVEENNLLWILPGVALDAVVFQGPGWIKGQCILGLVMIDEERGGGERKLLLDDTTKGEDCGVG